MSGTTLHITSQYVTINLPKIDNDGYSDSDKQTIVFLTSCLAGYSINYTNRSITLFLTLKGMYSYVIDFERGCPEHSIIQDNFDSAVAMLIGS